MIDFAALFNLDTHAGLARRIALTAYGLRLFNAAIAYGGQILFARWMGAADYGIYVMVWAFVLILGHISTLGLSVIPERFIPTYAQAARPDLSWGYTLFSRFAVFGAASMLMLLGMIGIGLFSEALDSAMIWPLYTACVCLPFFALSEMLDGIARCYNKPFVALGPPYVLRPVLMIGFFIFAHAVHLPATAATAMGSAFMACWVSAFVHLVLVRRVLAQHVPTAPALFTPRVWLLAAFPLFLVESARVVWQNVDILLVGRFVDPAELGVYFAASKTLALAGFIPFALGAAVSHRFTEYHVAGDTARFLHFLKQVNTWSFTATVLAIAFLAVFGELFLALFGETFTSGYHLLLILGTGLLLRSVIGPADRLLSVLGHQATLAKIVGLTLTLTFVLLFALTPLYGLNGAAVAMTLSALFETLLLLRALHRKLGLPLSAVVPGNLTRA